MTAVSHVNTWEYTELAVPGDNWHYYNCCNDKKKPICFVFSNQFTILYFKTFQEWSFFDFSWNSWLILLSQLTLNTKFCLNSLIATCLKRSKLVSETLFEYISSYLASPLDASCCFPNLCFLPVSLDIHHEHVLKWCCTSVLLLMMGYLTLIACNC